MKSSSGIRGAQLLIDHFGMFRHQSEQVDPTLKPSRVQLSLASNIIRGASQVMNIKGGRKIFRSASKQGRIENLEVRSELGIFVQE